MEQPQSSPRYPPAAHRPQPRGSAPPQLCSFTGSLRTEPRSPAWYSTGTGSGCSQPAQTPNQHRVSPPAACPAPTCTRGLLPGAPRLCKEPEKSRRQLGCVPAPQTCAPGPVLALGLLLLEGDKLSSSLSPCLSFPTFWSRQQGLGADQTP